MLPLLLAAIACSGVLARYAYVFRSRYLQEHSKNQQYKNYLTCLEGTTKDRQAELGELRSQLTQLQQKNLELEQQYSIVQQEAVALAEHNQQLISEQQRLQTEQEALEQITIQLKTDLKSIQLQLAETCAMNTILEQECDRLKTEQVNIFEENRRLPLQHFQRIKIISTHHAASQPATSIVHAKIDTDFSRVIEAVEFAELLFKDVLEIWDSARASAQASHFVRPADVYRHLQRLAWFGRSYFQQHGAIGGSLYQALKAQNLEYSSESETVQKNPDLLEQRRFWHRNTSKIMPDHLKLGGGRGIDNILRIYFCLNRDTQKVEIGHCGRHF